MAIDLAISFLMATVTAVHAGELAIALHELIREFIAVLRTDCVQWLWCSINNSALGCGISKR